MKLAKSYTVIIGGNSDKTSNILQILSQLNEMSEYVFEKGYNFWFNFNAMYRICRELYPDLNSKIVQNFLKFYRPTEELEPPKKAVHANIILDNQNFDLVFDPDTKLTNWWLRFGRRNYPLIGKRNLLRIKNIDNIKEARIFRRNGELYCKLTYMKEIPIQREKTDPVGLDLNVKRIAVSSNKIYSTKRWFHKKSEYQKHLKRKSKKDKSFQEIENENSHTIENFTKNHVHLMSNQIIKDLITRGSKVLILGDLEGLRESSSRKNGSSKGKTVNYMINNCFPFSMFREILSYKCLESGIRLELVDPAYTSQTCSRCDSLETHRPTQQRLKCSSCDYQIDADLNAARNIRNRYTESDGQQVNPARPALSASIYCPLGSSS